MFQLVDPCSVIYGGRTTRGFRITCANARCKKTETVHVNQFKGYGGDDHIIERKVISKFEHLGWKVKDKTALCPDCRVKRANQMKAYFAIKKEKAMLNGKTDQVQEQPVSTPPSKPVQPKMTLAHEAPREMTKTDRRVIFAKLEDVYGDAEDQGYRDGWTDQKVATDLGVPLAWVRTVRSENFGNIGDNPEIKAVIAQVRGFQTDLENIKPAVVQLENSYKNVMQKVTSLMQVAELIGRRLDKIQKATGG